jgi:hypothetical protein
MNDYDRIICCISHVYDDGPIREIQYGNGYYEQIDWGWGYEPEQFCDDDESYNGFERDWLIEANGHEYTWIPPELRDSDEWKDHEISVGGGGREECLRDFRDVLEHMGIPYRLVRGLTY